ncbi:hypothetical protein TVAG_179890 [Trichomonas vaginalis G3]|uniref:Right handed beta helix domain-containing protein n=1 Tax=Trichomonas vaginalis (strain ATCC PRA-98 / G3) TaxID=412133 RepID=A2F471_TRIV3|nr:hypothetical protein TVAGG3_1002430 [Trichomonas vaginalis G3]EAY00318.1 hypothetical protein TVAG_179890 [Trichomonas vaginalis G3]KAI5490891.1 hypothetical protein TVAGG3_1002430 [Trichomonas vaginalis G3]|eukprot:XP_001313247.1 hypothetical protein [Trichomonas vaginalis G3]
MSVMIFFSDDQPQTYNLVNFRKMNKTLVSLRIAGMQQPLLVNPLRSLLSYTSIKNFQISKSFSTFLQEKSLGGELSITRSKFNKFLDNVVKVDSNYDFIGVAQAEHQTVYGHNLNIIILESSFTHCSTTQGNGGALFLDRKTLAIRFDRCSFQKCTTKKSGGAFYGIIENLTCTRTCFDSCQATEAGHAYFLCFHKFNDTGNFSQCSFSQCATNTKLIGKSACFLLSGTFRNTLINATKNHALTLSSTFGSISSTNVSISFSLIANSSSNHILRFVELNESLVLGFCNFIGNKASVSLMQSTSRNNIINCVFIDNQVTSICTGLITYLQMTDCVLDVKYSFFGLAYIRTPGIKFDENVQPLPLRMEFASGCRILGEHDGIENEDHVKRIIEQIPENNRKFIDLYIDRMAFTVPHPTPRDKQPVPEEDILTKSVSTQKVTIEPQDEPQPKSRDRSSGRSQFIITPYVGPKRLTSSGMKQPKLFAPTASFSPSDTFYISRTFLPSLQFTASVSPAQSLVPYVLYSAAGFVVFGVLTSFLFLRSSDTGYNLMTPSESADSRISDYASSTSTTVTITGESSASVVV